MWWKLSSTDDSWDRSLSAYERLFRLENGLRELIIEEMGAKCGPKWWRQRVPGDVTSTAKSGKAYEASQPWRSKIVYHPIYYADFPSLRLILERADNWREVFEPIFRRKDLVLNTLSAVEPARNRIAHCRQSLREDVAALDQALSMLRTGVGDDRLNALIRRTTSLLDGYSMFNQYVVELVGAHTKLLRCSHIDSTTLRERPPRWLLEEVGEGNSDLLEEFDTLIREYAELPAGQGSALRLRHWPGRQRATELFDILHPTLQEAMGFDIS